MKNKFLAAVGAVLCLSQVASADSYNPNYRRKVIRPESIPEETSNEAPWYVFIGADVGVSNYSPYNNSQTETSRSGFNGGVRLLLAHYWDEFVLDGGAGWTYINNSGTNADGSKNQDTSKVAYLDLSPRFRIGKNFQIGPELEYWISTDQGLNPTVSGTDTLSTVSNTSGWIGAQALFEWTEEQKVRLGARGLYCFTGAPSRTVTTIQGFVQIGFDIFGSSKEDTSHYEQVSQRDIERAEEMRPSAPLVMATPEPTPEPLNPDPVVMTTPAPPEQESNTDTSITAPLSATSDMPAPAPVPAQKSNSQKVVLTLDMNDLPFGFNDANLPKSNANRVKNIGAYLADHNRAWKKLVIAGHTDERGKKDYNLRLSQNRAERVKDLLVEGGANGAKIQVIGYGSSRPKDPHHNERAWARNRRVELEFQGVSDIKVLKKALSQ